MGYIVLKDTGAAALFPDGQGSRCIQHALDELGPGDTGGEQPAETGEAEAARLDLVEARRVSLGRTRPALQVDLGRRLVDPRRADAGCRRRLAGRVRPPGFDRSSGREQPAGAVEVEPAGLDLVETRRARIRRLLEAGLLEPRRVPDRLRALPPLRTPAVGAFTDQPSVVRQSSSATAPPATVVPRARATSSCQSV